MKNKDDNQKLSELFRQVEATTRFSQIWFDSRVYWSFPVIATLEELDEEALMQILDRA